MQVAPQQGCRRWANRDVRREPDRRGRRLLWAMVAGFAVAVTPLGLWQLEHYECLRLAHEAEALRAEGARLAEQARQLRAEREALAALAGIEAWAARRGLERPAPERVVVVGSTGPATPGWLARNADRRSGGD